MIDAIVAAPVARQRCADSPIELSGARLLTLPFPHFVLRQCVDAKHAGALLAGLERTTAWRLVETDFYEQYEFSLLDSEHARLGGAFIDPIVLAELRRSMAALFE